MDEWAEDRAGDLADLLRAALPDEELADSDVARACWPDGASAVLALGDGSGAVAVRADHRRDPPVAGVLAMAVSAGRRRERRGGRLLEAASEWASSQGARQILAGGLPPWFLWPGIDVTWTAALALFERAGFAASGTVLNLSCPTDRSPPSALGVVVEPVAAGSAPAVAAVALARDDFPTTAWAEELERAVELGTAHVATDEVSGEVLGFACHSVNRAGWFGPTAVADEARGRRVGTALLGASLADLSRRGYGRVEICWVGPIGFYAKAAGASVSRVFRTAVRDL